MDCHVDLREEIPAEEILQWVNYARTRPRDFAEEIQKELDCFIEDMVIIQSGIRVQALEGKGAYREAIKFCKSQQPLEPLLMG